MVAREPAVARKPAPATPPGELSWSVWPARKRPLGAAVLLGSAVVLGILVEQGTGDRVLAVAAPLFVLVSVSSFRLPTTYRLHAKGFEVRSLGMVRTRPWSEIRRFEADPNGVFLSPFERKNWLDAYRGARLMTGGNRDQVVAFVEAKLAAGAA